MVCPQYRQRLCQSFAGCLCLVQTTFPLQLFGGKAYWYEGLTTHDDDDVSIFRAHV